VKIALLTYSTKPRGGVVHTLALAEALAAAGQHVTVWSLGRGGDAGFFRPVDPAVGVQIVPFPDGPADETVGARILRSIATLHAAFAPAPYDIVHAQDCISANAAGRCIRTVHHLDHFTTPELAACHERAIVEPYAHLCVSRSVADELAHGWGLKPAVIPNGVAYDRFAITDPAARAAWRSRLGPYVLTVGGIEPRKGSLDLLEAYALLRADHPRVRLVIAGQQLPPLVAAADTFAFPSAKEGFGLAAMEALAAGVPLVVRDLPVLREVFGRTARFADTPEALAAALGQALTRPDPARQAAGRALAARRTWAEAAQRHLAFYHSLG
jgi:glycosyltransferase involved in cell wall biosynthesis